MSKLPHKKICGDCVMEVEGWIFCEAALLKESSPGAFPAKAASHTSPFGILA